MRWSKSAHSKIIAHQQCSHILIKNDKVKKSIVLHQFIVFLHGKTTRQFHNIRWGKIYLYVWYRINPLMKTRSRIGNNVSWLVKYHHLRVHIICRSLWASDMKGSQLQVGTYHFVRDIENWRFSDVSNGDQPCLARHPHFREVYKVGSSVPQYTIL